MKRREFLKMTGSVAGGYVLGAQGALLAGSEAGEKTPEMPQRTLGRTGLEVSVIGFGGLALGRASQEESNESVRNAIEHGVNYFDVAPDYLDAEIKLGIALEGVDRSKLVLSSKTNKRDSESAQQELDRSLQRLNTDCFDVYQLHRLSTREEVKRAFGPGGAMEVLVKAKEQGKAKYLGFTAHSTRAALEALDNFDFDTVMFPINYIEYYKIGFGKEVLELASERNMGVFAMKAMCGGAWPQGMQRDRSNWYLALEDAESISLATRWALSHKQVATAITPGFVDLIAKCLPAGPSYRPITDVETSKLQEMAKSSVSLFERAEQGVAVDQPAYFEYVPGGCPHSMA
jgi:predicted aldo/keto reductase-like oxidoreductase